MNAGQILAEFAIDEAHLTAYGIAAQGKCDDV
jgi:hypothetical protein